MALFRNDSDEPLDLPALDLHVLAGASFVVTDEWAIAGLTAQPLVTLLSAPAAPPAADAAPAPADVASAPADVPSGAIEVDGGAGDGSVHDFTA